MEPFRLLFFLIGAAAINFYDYDPGKKKNSAADPIRERPIFQKLIKEELQENDLLLVTKMDQCDRNTLDFLKLQEKFFKKSVTFISLDLSYSNDMVLNNLIATNFVAIATFENERRKERQRQEI